jgi:hypothetical protein
VFVTIDPETNANNNVQEYFTRIANHSDVSMQYYFHILNTIIVNGKSHIFRREVLVGILS